MENPDNLPVSLLGVQPLPTEEYCGYAIGRVGDFHPFKHPSRAEARIIVLHSNSLQLSHVQHLKQETISLPTFEKIAKPLPQLPTTRVAIGAVDGDENIGICSCSLLVACDNEDLILDGDQAARLTGKALNDLFTLKAEELIPLWREGNEGIADEDVPKKRRILSEVSAENRNNEWMTPVGHDCLLVSKFFFSHNNLLYMPINFTFNFFPVFGCVAQADGSDIAQIF